MSAEMEVSAGLDAMQTFPASDHDEQAPEVFAQIVNDMDEGSDGEDVLDDSMAMVVSSASGSGTYIPPQLPVVVSDTPAANGFHVRLTLSVGASGATIAPGLEIDDCGVCPFCQDKPKYGGPGTKRQKCELKQQEASFTTEAAGTRVWGNLHLVSASEMEQMKQIQSLPLPEPLTAAIEIGPLPLVWAYRRKRRARTLPPAYVLMYYCEDRVPLDRSQLALSRQRYFKNSRADLAATSDKSKMRKPRVARPRMPTVAVYPGGEHPANMQPLAVAATQMGDPSLVNWQNVGPSSMCGPAVVYGQPVPGAPPAPMYAPPPQYMVSASQQAPGPMHSQPYSHQPVPYGAPPPNMYGPPPSMYPPPPPQPSQGYSQPPPHMPMPPPSQPASRRSKKGRSPLDDMQSSGMSGPPMGMGGPPPGMPPSGSMPPPNYYHTEQYYPPSAPSSSGPPPGPPMDMAPVGMEEEANSWIADPAGSMAPDYGSRAPKRPKQRIAPPPAPEPPPAPAPAPAPEADAGDDDAGLTMSNKTLELMLSRLQGQLPPATYEKVITLVRDVQCRRMSLSRSEFLSHFQAICAGQPKPR